MRKFGLLVAMAIAFGAARPAFAVLQFYRSFDEVYLKTHENEEFVKAARTAKMRCLICHQGKNRKNHNPYGIHLVELLDRTKDAKPDGIERVRAALAKVGAMHSDPKDDKSPTYDELLKAGKFPGGDYEAASKEPEKDAADGG
jgi:hypothetical protein